MRMGMKQYDLLSATLDGMKPWRRFADLLDKDHSPTIDKYLADLTVPVWDAIEHADEAGLLNAGNMRFNHVLDISTGAGFFPAVLKQLGCCVKHTFHDAPGHEILAECRELLGLRSNEGTHMVYKNNQWRPLPDGWGNFNLITANHCPPMDVWEGGEWEKFFLDCRDRLSNGPPRGSVYIWINRQCRLDLAVKVAEDCGYKVDKKTTASMLATKHSTNGE